MSYARSDETWASNFFLAWISYIIGAWIQGPWVGFGYTGREYFYLDFNFWYSLAGVPNLFVDTMSGLDLIPTDANAW